MLASFLDRMVSTAFFCLGLMYNTNIFDFMYINIFYTTRTWQTLSQKRNEISEDDF